MNNKITTFWASEKEIKTLQIIAQTERKTISEAPRILITEGGLRRGIEADFTDVIERSEDDQRQ